MTANTYKCGCTVENATMNRCPLHLERESMTEKCSIHYHACECREAKFARVIEAARMFLKMPTPDYAKHVNDLEESIRDFEGKK